MSARDLSRELGVSIKLINVWAVKHGLLTRTPEMKLP